MIIEEITMGEFSDGLKLTRTVYIPFGSTEEHGPHLPLSTDTLQAYEVGKAASKVIPLFVAPPIHYGSCRSTSRHPGTVSITTATVQLLMKDIVRSLHQQGLRRFIVVTGHAGGAHRMALQDAGESLIAEIPDIHIAVVTEYEVALRVGEKFIETKDDSHAGEIETSRIMWTHQHLVKGSAEKEYPRFPDALLVRDKRRYWPGGVWGDPTKATVEKGRQLQEGVVEYIVQLARRMDALETEEVKSL